MVNLEGATTAMIETIRSRGLSEDDVRRHVLEFALSQSVAGRIPSERLGRLSRSADPDTLDAAFALFAEMKLTAMFESYLSSTTSDDYEEQGWNLPCTD
jgi:hypothetical protein